jgi:hypothetical protein
VTMMRINKKQCLAGVLFLLIGTAEYVFGRPRGSVYFLEKLGALIPVSSREYHLFGPFGGWAPDFFHALGFALISMAFFKGRSSRVALCILWFAIEAAFKIALKSGKELASHVPSWFGRIPILENTASYLRKGVFDIFDLVAFALGCLVAFALGELLSRKEEQRG